MAVKITYTEDQKYGIPQLKKYPMPDKRHVISAIKFFNYVEPKYEKQLAKAILARIKEYGMSFDDFGVGEDNRFSKYLPERALAHHGILGQKWGVRRFQNEDGTLTAAGKKRRETINKASEYSKKEVKYHADMIDHYKNKGSEQAIDKYYSGKDGWKKWLQDNYGDDWKNPEYMRVVEEVYDVKNHALEEIAREKKMARQEDSNMVDYYTDGKKYWEEKAKFYENTPISNINNKDYKLAKKYAKRFEKDSYFD